MQSILKLSTIKLIFAITAISFFLIFKTINCYSAIVIIVNSDRLSITDDLLKPVRGMSWDERVALRHVKLPEEFIFKTRNSTEIVKPKESYIGPKMLSANNEVYIVLRPMGEGVKIQKYATNSHQPEIDNFFNNGDVIYQISTKQRQRKILGKFEYHNGIRENLSEKKIEETFWPQTQRRKRTHFGEDGPATSGTGPAIGDILHIMKIPPDNPPNEVLREALEGAIAHIDSMHASLEEMSDYEGYDDLDDLQENATELVTRLQRYHSDTDIAKTPVSILMLRDSDNKLQVGETIVLTGDVMKSDKLAGERVVRYSRQEGGNQERSRLFDGFFGIPQQHPDEMSPDEVQPPEKQAHIKNVEEPTTPPSEYLPQSTKDIPPRFLTTLPPAELSVAMQYPTLLERANNLDKQQDPQPPAKRARTDDVVHPELWKNDHFRPW